MQPQRAKIIVTTSHRPSQRARSFAKDLASVLPNAIRINRGKMTLTDLYYEAYTRGAERVVIIGLKKGNPAILRVYRLGALPEEGLQQLATITLAGVKLRRETPGSQRIFGTHSLAIDARNVHSEEAARVVDVIAKSFLAKILVGNIDEELLEKFDVIASVRETKENLEVVFMCPHTGRVCGPTLRVTAVTDLDAKIHVYIPKREVLPAKTA